MIFWLFEQLGVPYCWRRCNKSSFVLGNAETLDTLYLGTSNA